MIYGKSSLLKMLSILKSIFKLQFPTGGDGCRLWILHYVAGIQIPKDIEVRRHDDT